MRSTRVRANGAPMYFTIYFLTTGLHALHVIIGMSVLIVLTFKTANGRFSSKYYTGLELGGLYWHLVDLVWIFLFPLLYLSANTARDGAHKCPRPTSPSSPPIPRTRSTRSITPRLLM